MLLPNLLAANGLRTASTQEKEVQGSVTPLTERGDEAFSVGSFFSANRK